MSTTPRRRSGGVGTRRPQVAGRPRGAAPAESEETTDGTLAVGERTDTRSGAERTRSGARSRTVSRSRGADGPVRTGSDDDGPGTDAAAPVEGTEAGVGEKERPAEDTADVALPAAPAVRSGESDEAEAPARRPLAERLRRVPRPAVPTTRRAVAALLAVTILLTAAAVFFAVSWSRLQFSGATSNSALADVGTTATVSEQVGEDITKVYSFDYARLDQAESDARAVITGPFTAQFDQIFGNVRQLAPKQQAVVTATIPKSAVASIDGDQAVVYAFVNQVARRVDDAGKTAPGTAAARIRVDATYVDGRWKISGITPG